MAEFKVGDQVIRQKNLRHGAWGMECARHDRADDDVFTVVRVDGGVLWVDALPSGWDSDCFRRAYPPVPHPATELPHEDLLLESDAHIECLRDLLEAEKQQVGNLLALNNVLVDQAAHLQAKIAGLQAEVAELQAEARKYKSAGLGVAASLGEASSAYKEMQDQRDGALVAAKSLGSCLRVAREEVRWGRFTRRKLSGLCDALFAATADIDLHHVATQLYLLAQMCEEQGNGADAALAYNAAQVVELTSVTLESLNEVQEYTPHHIPPMEGPLA